MLHLLTTGTPEFHRRNWQAWSIWLAIFLFPVFAAGAKGGASYPFALLALVGLVYGWRSWPDLMIWERHLFAGFAVLFVAVFVSFLLGDDVREGGRRIEKYATFLFVVPAYLAVRRYVKEPGRPFLAGLLLAPFGALFFGLDWDFTRMMSVLLLRERLGGFYDTIILGNIAGLMTLLLLAAVLLFARRWGTMLAGGALVLLGLLVVAAAASRNGLLFIPVGMMVVFGDPPTGEPQAWRAAGRCRSRIVAAAGSVPQQCGRYAGHGCGCALDVAAGCRGFQRRLPFRDVARQRDTVARGAAVRRRPGRLRGRSRTAGGGGT